MVLLAPLTIPSTPPVNHDIAVKFGLLYEPEMLLNEMTIYNAFPRNLQDGDAPVVPKFYGHCVPSSRLLLTIGMTTTAAATIMMTDIGNLSEL
jgi:hypothetical protein